MTAPVRRTSFYDEQARHRRRTLRFTVLSAVAVALSGIPVSVIVTPLLFLAVLLVAHLIQLITPIAPEFWNALNRAGRTVPVVLDQIDRAIQTHRLGAIDWDRLALFGLVLVVPGMVLMVLVWLWVRILFRRGGVGGVLQSLGARLPRAGDLEERQLVNLVEEMSIAAGIKPPQVLLIDTSTANAAAVGTEPADARILVTRGLLATLDREQTQAVIGHLIASICNGDLRIALRLLAVFQTFGLLNVLLAGASDRKARSSLWQAIKGVFWARDRSQVDRVADLLAQGEGTDSGAGSTKSGCLTTIITPFALGAATAQFLSYIGASMVFGPFLAALWRARRYLADATAVQLTRNPSALANALLELSRGSDQLKAPPSASLLFVLWQGSEKLVAVGSFHPSVGKRIHRLQAEGARLTVREQPWDAAAAVALRERSAQQWVGRLIMVPLMAFVYTLLAVGVVAMLAGAVLMMGVTFFFVTLAIFAIHAVFTYGPSFLHWLVTEGPQLLKAIGEMIALLIRHLKK